MAESNIKKNKTSSVNTRPDGFSVDLCIFTISSKKQKTVRKSLPINELKILLVKDKESPLNVPWSLPQGIANKNVSLREAAIDTLASTIHYNQDFYLEQIKTVYYPGREFSEKQPKNKDLWIPSSIYYAFVKNQFLDRLNEENDDKEARLFSIEELSKLNLVNDQREIILGGLSDRLGEETNVLEIIKEKMLQTTIAKEFLPEEFTISELLQVIQSVVPEFSVEKPNFIRKMVSTKSRQGIIEEVLDENGKVKTSDAFSQRSAKLYRFLDYEPKISIYNSTLQ